MPGKVINLDVVFYKSGGKFVAHCLQLDLVQESISVEQARCDMEDVIQAHIDYTIEHNNWTYFYKPAPELYWSLLPESEDIGEDGLESDTSIRNWQSSQELSL